MFKNSHKKSILFYFLKYILSSKTIGYKTNPSPLGTQSHIALISLSRLFVSLRKIQNIVSFFNFSHITDSLCPKVFSKYSFEFKI